MTEKQLTLFRLPNTKEITLTLTDREVLAWVEYSEGQFAVWPRRFQPKSLRRLMDKGLVKVIALSPARYMLTPLGRAVRSRDNYRKQERRLPIVPPNEQFFQDHAEG